MGKSKKPFIDKKNSSTFHLLHRSQRDVGDVENDSEHGDGSGVTTSNSTPASRVILWPSPDNRPETNEKVLQTSTGGSSSKLTRWKEQMNQLGLVDEYDYEKHMKPITGTGAFVDAASGRQVHDDRALQDARSHVVLEEGPDTSAATSDVKEVSRQLESIALTADCMDDDIAQALFGDFDGGNFEEILDDFCMTAAEEPEEEEAEAEFDYDAHIRSLMERAAKQDRGELDVGVPMEQHNWGKNDVDFFEKQTALQVNDDESDHDEFDLGEEPTTTLGVVSALSPDEERALCEKFEETLLEYDSDDMGDLDSECEDIRGARPLEGDAHVEAALEEFLVEKKDEIFMEGTRHLTRKHGGSGFAALVDKSMVPAADLDSLQVDDKAIPVQEILADASQVLANPEMEPPPEEVLIDGKSYFSERSRNPWDCESILTTYSNLDNNPVTIESRRRTKMKKKRVSPESSIPEDEPERIQLSRKTGLPVLASGTQYYEGDDTINSVNLGEARNKNETKAEKKTRKLMVKQERQIARIQKKMMKEAFAEEFSKRTGEILADDVGGKSVFRYS